MKRIIVLVLAMVLVAVVAIAQEKVTPPAPAKVEAPKATPEQLQNTLAELSQQVRVQVALRDKAVREIQDTSNQIDKLVAQIQQVQAELKKVAPKK